MDLKRKVSEYFATANVMNLISDLYQRQVMLMFDRKK